MKIRDLLLIDPELAAEVSTIPSDANPFKEEAALQEAQLLDFRFDALAGVAGLIFELRQSLQLWESNTGVLVADRVSAFAWSGPKRTRCDGVTYSQLWVLSEGRDIQVES